MIVEKSYKIVLRIILETVKNLFQYFIALNPN